MSTWGSALSQADVALGHLGYHPSISPDVGPLSGGTIVYSQGAGGYEGLGPRTPVDLRRPLRYHGGSITFP